MAKKNPQSHEIGIKLNKQGSARTYNEKDEGIIYNNNNEGLRVQTEGADRELVTDTQTQTLSGKTLTSPTINGGTITSATVSSPSINNAVSSDGVFTSPTINTPTISGGTVTSSAINSATITSPSINAAVLSNSVFNVDSNTLSNVEVDNLKSGVLNTSLVGGGTDLQVPSAKAAKDYADSVSGGVQTSLTNHLNDTTDAHMASAIGVSPYMNLASTNAQAAFQELQADIDTRELASNKGAANGYCPLGADSKVSATYLPSYVDDVVEVANYADLPVTGETGKIYITLDTNLTYRWTGSTYAEISQSLALGETSTTAYRGDRGKTAYDHSQLTSATHGISGSFVGTTDTQVLTNKDIDGGTAADTRRITVPKDSLANITALTRKEGTVLYGSDTDKLYVDNGTTLTAVGAGGVGDPSVYALLKSDDDSSTWSTGNNATFLGGGVIAGTFTKQNATNPLNGTYSYTFTQAAGSLNDYFCSESQPVPLRARNSANTATNLCRLKYTYDGANGDIRIVVYDATNSTILTSLSQVVTANADYNRKNEVLFEVPATCVNLKFGFQVLVANNGKILKFDDVEFTDDPFTVANLVEQEYVSYSGTNGWDASNRQLFRNLDPSSKYGKLISVSNTGYTKYTFNKPCSFTATSVGNLLGVAPTYLEHYNASGVLKKRLNVYNVDGRSAVPYVGIAEVGDYINVTQPAYPYADAASSFFSVSATTISSNVIQSWQDGMAKTATLSYTQVNALSGNQGLGAFTAGYVSYVRVGDSLRYSGKLTVGTTTANEARLPLPAGLISADSTIIPSIRLLGVATRSELEGGQINILIEPSVGYLTFGYQSSNTAQGITKSNGSLILASGNTFSFDAVIPIQGWSATPTLLALPTSKENVFSASINSSGAITSASNSWLSSVTKGGTGSYTLNFVSGIFTTAPAVVVSLTDSVSDNHQKATVTSVSSSSVTITVYNSTGVMDRGFTVHVQKQSPDYQAPGVFIAGGIARDWTYDLTVTGTNWTTTRARGTVYKTGDGSYHLRFNIVGSVTSATLNAITLSISGVTFKNVSGYQQSVNGSTLNALPVNLAYVSPNTSTLFISHTSGTVTGYIASGDVELESRPSWAVNTN